MRRREALSGILVLATAWGLGACRRLPRLVLIGDSTVADYPDRLAPMSGWGQALRGLRKGKDEVINRAIPGSSTLSYARDHWRVTAALLHRDDRVLIQFGHIDELPDPARHTEPGGRYRELLNRFVVETRRAGAQPVLVTPLPRCRFEAGRVADSHGPYAETVRLLAREAAVPLVDLARLGAQAMERVGEKQARTWFMLAHDGHDNVHLNINGALVMAALVETALNQAGLLRVGLDYGYRESCRPT